MVKYEEIAGMIDHSLLKPYLTDKEKGRFQHMRIELRVVLLIIQVKAALADNLFK